MAITINGSGTLSGVTAGLTAASMPSGSVLQVVQAVKTDTTSHDTTTWTDISGLSVSITPSNASNKVLVYYSAAGCTVNIGYIRLVRDSTVLGSGDASSSRTSCGVAFCRQSSDSQMLESFTNSYLDSPSTTSATTYKLQWRDENGTIYLNRSVTDSDSVSGIRCSSVITAMEIKG